MVCACSSNDDRPAVMKRSFAGRMNRWQSCNVSTACLLLLLVLILQSCASPSARLDQLADEQGFNSRFLKAGGFKLKVYENDRKLLQSTTATGDQSEHVLHVYLEAVSYTHLTLPTICSV